MINPAIPENEAERQQSLEAYHILDTENEKRYDKLIELASMICDTPISLISLVDGDRQWFKAKKGIITEETSREFSFCAHAINDHKSYFEVEDATKDNRFHDNPLVTGQPEIRFYGGIPLQDKKGLPLGTLCVIDQKPKKLNKQQIEALQVIAEQVMAQMELQKISFKREKENKHLNTIVQNLTDVVYESNYNGQFLFFNRSIQELSEYEEEELIGKHFTYLIVEEDQERVIKHYQDQIKQRIPYTELEFKIKTKSGRLKCVSQKVTMLFKKTGYVERIVAIVRDISEEHSNKVIAEEKTNLLTTVVSTMIEGVMVFDKNGKFLLANNALEEMLNHSSEHTLEECMQSFEFYEEDQETELPFEDRPSYKVLSGETIHNMVLYIKSPDIDGLYLNINGSPMTNESGEIIGGILLLTDITGRKKEEFQQLKNASLIEQAKELAGVGHWEVNLEEGTVFWSDETRKIHEVGSSYIPNLEEGINFYDEESRPQIIKAVESAIENNSGWDEKLKIITAKGNLRWVRTIGKSHKVKNKVTRLFGVFQDVTKDKQYEQNLLNSQKEITELNQNLELRIQERTKELEESKVLFQKLYNNAPDMLLSIDPVTGKVVECNTTTYKKLGCLKKEVVGKSVMEFYHPVCHEEVKQAIAILNKTGKVENKKLYVQSKEGEKLAVRLNAKAVKNKQGKIIRTNSIWRDISKLEETEVKLYELNQHLEKRVEERTEQLKKANEELEEFTYITTHDLKLPIANIEGFITLLESELQNYDSELVSKSLKFMTKGVESIKKRIEGILEVAKIYDSVSEIEKEVDISNLLEGIKTELSALIEEHRVDLKVSIVNAKQVYTNPFYLKTTLFNLLSNSIKYRQPEKYPKIELKIKKEDRSLKIEVKDNGVGMNLKNGTEKLFGMFTRMHDHVEGSGLGMHLTKKMIDKLQGDISVKSAINEGTEFTIIIPLKNE